MDDVHFVTNYKSRQGEHKYAGKISLHDLHEVHLFQGLKINCKGVYFI